MGFLHLPGGVPGFEKAVISLWFRLSTETATAVLARDASYDPGENPSVLGNVVPLLLFGGQPTGTQYDFFSGVIGYDTGTFGPPIPVNGGYVTGSHNVAIQPSCIGVYVGGGGTPTLFVNIQSNKTANCEYTSSDRTLYGYDTSLPGTSFVIVSSSDISYTDEILTTAYFGNAQSGGAPPLALDQWHHILMSWDVSGPNGSVSSFNDFHPDAFEDYFSSFSRIWCAVDDADKNGPDLPAPLIGGSAGQNSTAISAVYDSAGGVGTYTGLSGSSTSSDQQTYHQRKVTWSGTIASTPIWIPAPSVLTRSGSGTFQPNQQVEMSDLQIFAGVTLNTGNTSNRRAFVTAGGKPADPALAQQLLGKAPDILLRKSKKWIKGTNAGTAGNFSPIGTIAESSDSPSL